ncbi:formate dehydrogenase accessory protein FdhE (plasmid) [Roseomonas gilardii subsp. gilardii]|uniref:formate dehydrogenase accessory protein FdhE n=1 Tax=Roseomonas gilardii TaxID=257708 RepID=UPI001FFBB757|nr:formate dehydrogenase accessory protein FdhE [Roseomonas gilardii]UPG74797.1 formate dehydrogenase accessory protein FdhE [Roseomonas gilardii subsp. gilardii]
MSGFQNLQPDPSLIGRMLKPPFAIMPDPVALFRQRAERFSVLAGDSHLAPYLDFLAGLSGFQADLAGELPPALPISDEQVRRARENRMPPLDRAALAGDTGLRALAQRFLEGVAALPMPPPAEAALAGLRQAAPEDLDQLIGNVLADSIPADDLPRHLFLSAAVQVHAARLASLLDPKQLVPVETGLCPCCGGPPASSMVVGHQGAEGARYAACAFCGTQWNEVRIKCLACGSTKGVGYMAPESEDEAAVKAETCDSCRSWVKILYQNRNPSLEPVADDVASLGLDLLMRDTQYRRAGFDPFLLGY